MRNCQMKKLLGMKARQRRKAQIIVICIFIMILVFVIHQIVSKYNVISVSFDNSNADSRSEVDQFSDIEKSMEISQLLDRAEKIKAFSGEKLIHLDLKGAPPLISYYAALFPFLRRLGATGILLEYEDMFPYKDELEKIKACNAYTSSDIRTILRLAEDNNLAVIPLVQTMGHLEFVLKLAQFRELREIDQYPQNLCPSHEKVQFFIEKMVDQVMEAHPKARHIHIGCDEVFFLGECDRCKAAMRKNFWTSQHLFLNHVERTALYINKTYPGVRPIIWGDMLHRVDGQVIESSFISQLVDLMLWNYHSKVSDIMTAGVMLKFAKYFKSVWIASAFKGATTASSVMPNVGSHLANHMSWMALVTLWKKSMNFKGIAITGWQRYDHFAVLCELLPVGLPSLTLDMLYIQNPSAEDHKARLIKFLGCQSVQGFDPPDFAFFGGKKCNFPGFKIFRLVSSFVNLTSRLNGFSGANMKSGWFSMYNVVHEFTSPHYVKKMFQIWPLDAYRDELDSLEEKLTAALTEVYDRHTVEEWIMTHLTPIRMRLDVFLNAKEVMLHRRVWPRRPFVTESALDNASEICGVDRRFGCSLLVT